MTSRKPSVLVVDDEPEVVELLKTLLSQAGFDAQGLTSPADALQKAKIRSYDALVLDLYMPEMPGLLFHAKLRVIAPRLAERTLFISGHVSGDEVRRWLAQKARFMQKPLDLPAFIKAVGELAGGDPGGDPGKTCGPAE